MTTTRAAGPRVRPPQQARSREAWQRILDSGLDVLAEQGVARFNVSAVCERAGVAATAVYSRVGTRDDLLHAVYEEGAERVRATEQEVASAVSAPDPAAAVDLLVAVFDQHGPFLRAVVLGAGDDDIIARGGRRNLSRAREVFIEAAVGSEPDAESRRRAGTLFTTAFSVLAFELAFGPALVHEQGETAAESLHALARDLLGGPPPARARGRRTSA